MRPDDEDFLEPPPSNDLGEAIRQGIELAKKYPAPAFFTLPTLDDLERPKDGEMPGRLPGDAERKMWTECVHGVHRGARCRRCEEENRDR